MKPIEFEGCNVVFAKDQPEYQPLPAKHHGDDCGTIETEWELTAEERQAIADGKNLRLSVITFNRPLQPVLITVVDSK